MKSIDSTSDKKWKRIRIYADHYEGWIDQQTASRSFTRVFRIPESGQNFKITTDLTSGILFNKNCLGHPYWQHHSDFQFRIIQDGGAVCL